MEIKREERKIHLTLKLNESFNKELEKATTKSGRSKRIEAERRLRDHLKRFPNTDFTDDEA